jgi:hypothetical protein
MLVTLVSQTKPQTLPSKDMPGEGDTELVYTGKFLRDFGDSMRDLKSLALEDMTIDLDKTVDRQDTLKKLAALEKLTTLQFFNCDLSKINENDPIPQKVDSVLIRGGKVSQSTIRWLAKFPSGVEIVFVGDLRGLDFQLGHFNVARFRDCKMSRSAIGLIVEKMRICSFEEVTLFDDKTMP